MVDTSDFILLVAALFIYALLQLNLNSVLLNNTRVVTKTELDYTGVALAQNIADEARWKAFDEAATVTAPQNIPGDFSTIGLDGEAYPNFDDFDDYDGYTRTDLTAHGEYQTICKVDYVTGSNLDQVSTLKTPYKRLLVEVVSETGDTTAVTYTKSYY